MWTRTILYLLLLKWSMNWSIVQANNWFIHLQFDICLSISIKIMIEIEEALWLAADDVDKNFDQSDCTFRYWILLGRRRLLWHDSIYASPTTITTTIATFCRKFACYNNWSKKITGCDGDRSLLTLEDSRSNLAINIFIKEYLYR